MRSITTTIIGLLITAFSVFGQVPQGINYQAVVRGAGGQILSNQSVSLRVSIVEGNTVPVYTETHIVTTTDLGLANMVLGQGTPTLGVFSNLDWTTGNLFVQTELDVSGGSNYQLLGSQQLMSVPYAFYAEKAANTPNIQRGKEVVGASLGQELVVTTVTFPQPFESAPYVVCTVAQEAGSNFDDSFSATIRSVTNTGFEAVVNRVDGSTWGQVAEMYWIAVD